MSTVRICVAPQGASIMDIFMFGQLVSMRTTCDATGNVVCIYTVIMTLAFLYQLNSGLSPFFVLVSAMFALPAMKSSCRYVRAKRPVIAVYMGSMTSKSVGKRMSK
jgi:hypothetical protein